MFEDPQIRMLSIPITILRPLGNPYIVLSFLPHNQSFTSVFIPQI